MKRVKIVNIVGARPQFIKMALVAEAAREFPTVDFVIVHTGQHYDSNMSGIFFNELRIPEPDYNLNIGSSSHTEQIGRMTQALGDLFLVEKPDMVFVYGDTNSTIAGALASVKMNIPLAHVEAGLRSFVKTMPEEVNRIVTDRISDILFCPTGTAVMNLRREGITRGVYRVSDVMIDMLHRYAGIALKRSCILDELRQRPRGYYLATTHRAHNTDDAARLKRLIKAFGSLDKPVIFPIHPRTKKVLSAHRVKVNANITVIPPVSYVDMLMLEMNAAAILTDSGGVQKEAYFFRVPCVTLREETEWVETVKAGWNILAGVEEDKIARALKKFSSRRIRPAKERLKDTGSSARSMLTIALQYLRGER